MIEDLVLDFHEPPNKATPDISRRGPPGEDSKWFLGYEMCTSTKIRVT